MGVVALCPDWLCGGGGGAGVNSPGLTGGKSLHRVSGVD